VGGLIEFQIDAETDAIVICGSTGENQALSVDERGQLIDCAIRTARGRIAVIAATGCETQAETLALSERATRSGADGLLVITPRATPAPQDGVVAYIAAVASRTDLPVYIYNYPQRTHFDISAESIERLVFAHPNVVGLKQTDASLRLVTQVRSRLGPDFHTFCGIEQLALPGLALGSAGMITASGNIVPRQSAPTSDTPWEFGCSNSVSASNCSASIYTRSRFRSWRISTKRPMRS
jgi:4-hydroxy-tetrahydrodipicolinate synthase